MPLDIETCDELLSTTRAVRKRLDLTRPVPRDVIEACLELAVQAPTGSNSQTWRWVVVDDADKRRALADLYRRGGEGYLTGAGQTAEGQTARVFSSALYLMEHLAEVPVHVIPCLSGAAARGCRGHPAWRLFRVDLPGCVELPVGFASARIGHLSDDIAPRV